MIREDLNIDESDGEECLQLATHIANSNTGPELLCPILLVSGDFPRSIRSHNASSEHTRATDILNVFK